MQELLNKIANSLATLYILSFAGLSIMLMLALNSLHKFFTLSERAWGLLTLGAGVAGGLLLHQTGLVTLPTAGPWEARIMAAFIGAGCSAAAAGFSAVDLRAIALKQKE